MTTLEMELYKKLDISPPRSSSEERAQKRLAWRNERTLYKRNCDATGENIISIFDSGTSFPVYSQQYWWSDNWSALQYARAFDFNKTFFEQFIDLFSVLPQCALRCPQSENCEYTNQCEKNKDCYLVFCSNNSRECMYGMWYQTCTECLDCTYLEKGELCYEILNGKNCYFCTFSENTVNCSNCHFSRNLIGCSYCTACINLNNKTYCIFNKQYSKDEYFKTLNSFDLEKYSKITAFKKQFEEFSLTLPFKFYNGANNENFSGDYLENNKNTFNSFNCRNSENIFHCRDAWSARNSIDLTETLEQDFCLELEGCYKNTASGFSSKISETHNTWYSSHCFNSSDLFGCVGLRQGKFSILNKEYSKEEFLKLREKIILHMKETKEWGQYFPIKNSPFAYNESVAQEYFPLTKEEVLSLGLRWKDFKENKSLAKQNLAETIKEVDQSILTKVITCEISGRSYKIQKSELDFLKKLNLPLPRLHHDIRHTKRLGLRNPRKLLKTSCAKCAAPLESSFREKTNKIIYCEKCFQECLA